MFLELIPIGIRIGMPWMLIPIRSGKWCGPTRSQRSGSGSMHTTAWSCPLSRCLHLLLSRLLLMLIFCFLSWCLLLRLSWFCPDVFSCYCPDVFSCYCPGGLIILLLFLLLFWFLSSCRLLWLSWYCPDVFSCYCPDSVLMSSSLVTVLVLSWWLNSLATVLATVLVSVLKSSLVTVLHGIVLAFKNALSYWFPSKMRQYARHVPTTKYTLNICLVQ